MEREQLLSEALLHAGKARTMAAKLFNDPQASQVDAGDLLISMAQLVDLLCEAATTAAAPQPLTDEQIDDLAEPFIRDLGGDHWYSGERGISEGGAQDFARAVERAHGIGASTKESNQ